MDKKIVYMWIGILLLSWHGTFCVEAVNDDVVGEDVAFSSEIITRADGIPKTSVNGVDDNYLRGYIQALVDVHYHEFGVTVSVKDKNVFLSNLPKDGLIARSIITFVEDFPGVKEVGSVEVPENGETYEDVHLSNPQAKGTWMPQSTVLFPPLIADPRQVSYSAGYRFYDDAMSRYAFAMSIGDIFPLYRWHNVKVGKFLGDLQLSLEPGVWAVFDTDKGSFPLINTDFSVAVMMSYAVDKLALRARLYHMSSHLGDEYIINNPSVTRVNVSVETIDLFASYQLTDAIRTYAGMGYVLHSDKEYTVQPLYVEYGAELHLLGNKSYYHKLYVQPFLAMHFRNQEDNGWNLDATYATGCEWSKLQGVGRKIRAYVEYHDGFSREGQFSRVPTDYLAIKFSYGF